MRTKADMQMVSDSGPVRSLIVSFVYQPSTADAHKTLAGQDFPDLRRQPAWSGAFKSSRIEGLP
jgi:hypothetical protein